MAVQGYTPNQLSLLTNNIEGAPQLLAYNAFSLSVGNTGDSIATIQGTNYFSDGQKRGLALGNTVLVQTDFVGGAGLPVGHICYVSAVQDQAVGFGATLTVVSGTT